MDRTRRIPCNMLAKLHEISFGSITQIKRSNHECIEHKESRMNETPERAKILFIINFD